MDNFHYQTAEFLSKLLDEQFSAGKFKFGLDPILGLIPWVGDFFSFLLSLYIVWIGIQLNLPQAKISQMVGNVVFDFILGLIPIVGDLSDFVFKANKRNMEILRAHLATISDGEIV